MTDWDDYDDHDWGIEVEIEAEAHYRDEMAIAHHIEDRERDDEDRARRDRR